MPKFDVGGLTVQPVSIAAGDVNGDGLADLVVEVIDHHFISFSDNILSPVGDRYAAVYLSNGDGTFSRSSTVSVSNAGSTAVPMGLADINGDGHLDFVADLDFTQITNDYLVALGNGDGTFQSPLIYTGSVAIGINTSVPGDFNGDGKPDVAEINPGSFTALPDAAGSHGIDPAVSVLLNTPGFATPSAEINTFSLSSGWTSDDLYPRELADVNGDGKADIVGFGVYGVYVALASSTGTFDGLSSEIRQFGSDPSAGGWTSDTLYERKLADVNGDGMADIVGFGVHGVYVSLATGGGHFGGLNLSIAQFGLGADAGGWTSNNAYPRVLADVNGDGMADIVGFGEHGVYVALATGGGHFGGLNLSIAQFGLGADAGGWTSNNAYPRALADVNGDGMADIVGFGEHGVYVALATGGGHFGGLNLSIEQFGFGADAGGWNSQDHYPRQVADINGDGRADLVGFGDHGVYTALGQNDGTFGPADLVLSKFGAAAAAGAWTSNDLYPRVVADVTGDGRADIVGFGQNHVWTSHMADFLLV